MCSWGLTCPKPPNSDDSSTAPFCSSRPCSASGWTGADCSLSTPGSWATDSIRTQFKYPQKATGVTKSFRSFRKLAANRLGRKPDYAGLQQHFLGHAPADIAHRHYEEGSIRPPSMKQSPSWVSNWVPVILRATDEVANRTDPTDFALRIHSSGKRVATFTILIRLVDY